MKKSGSTENRVEKMQTELDSETEAMKENVLTKMKDDRAVKPVLEQLKSKLKKKSADQVIN